MCGESVVTGGRYFHLALKYLEVPSWFQSECSTSIHLPQKTEIIHENHVEAVEIAYDVKLTELISML